MKHFDIEVVRTPNDYLVYLIHEGRAPADPPLWAAGGQRVATLSVSAPSLGEAIAHALIKYAQASGHVVDDVPANV